MVFTTNGNDLLFWDEAEWEIVKSDNSPLSSNILFPIYIDRSDTVWCSYWNSIVVYTPESCTTSGVVDRGFFENKISTIAIDNEGNKWIGSEESGLLVMSDT